MQTEPPKWTGSGPGPYPLVYAAMLINGLLLISAVYGIREGHDRWFQISAGAFAFAAVLLILLRVVIHDIFVGLTVSVRTFYFLVFGVMFFIPGAVRGHSVLPEGFAVALPVLTLCSIHGPAIRRWILFSMAGFWAASFSHPAPGLLLTLAYGLSLLWVFAAAHFAETGEPFGLRGWWPARTTLVLSALYFVPAALVALGTYFLWPEFHPEGRPQAPPPVTARAAMDFSPADINTLLLRFFAWLGLVLVSFILIVFIRRRLGRGRRPGGLPKVFGMDVGDMQFFQAPEARKTKGLSGERGRIVRLWMKWAWELGEGRGESETAREVAGRVTRDRGPASADRELLTELLEKAHYGEEEPTRSDAEAMKKAVRRELKR